MLHVHTSLGDMVVSADQDAANRYAPPQPPTCKFLLVRVLISPAQISYRYYRPVGRRQTSACCNSSVRISFSARCFPGIPRLRSVHRTPRACQLCTMESYLCGTCVLHESTDRPNTDPPIQFCLGSRSSTLIIPVVPLRRVSACLGP
jgi:hypothetical protein